MPRIIIALFIASIAFTGCKQDQANTDTVSNDGEVSSLQNKVNQLELDNAMKDSVINESLAFFNEIKSNLEAIGIRKDEIRAISENSEISGDDKEWILEEIQHINFLREDNARKVKQMQGQMKKNGLKIKELEIMIESLLKDIQWKDEQITLLQSELNNLDREYSALFDAYQEQAIQLDAVTDEMNAVYYAYGTATELRDNGVIEKKNGFLGIGKKTELKDDMNDQYFTRIDATAVNSVKVIGENIHFVTYHPKTSYELEETANGATIKILDASEFWKISKYLVVIVD
ncbi:MAG: hypothetical protein ACPGVI_02020 [Crocinitomicaceae bacterium]